MNPIKDELGKRYTKLTVIGLDYEKLKDPKYHNAFWICKCDCGNVISTLGSRLRSGECKSCGCYSRERSSIDNATHRQTKTRIYRIWQLMKRRCYKKTSKDYKNYGGRGIKVCDEWKNSFECFRDWALPNGYNEHLTIERINVNGDYEPSNCTWATPKQQGRNRRKHRKINYNGKEYCLSELAEMCGLIPETLAYRLNVGYELEKAMFTPSKRRNKND